MCNGAACSDSRLDGILASWTTGVTSQKACDGRHDREQQPSSQSSLCGTRQLPPPPFHYQMEIPLDTGPQLWSWWVACQVYRPHQNVPALGCATATRAGRADTSLWLPPGLVARGRHFDRALLRCHNTWWWPSQQGYRRQVEPHSRFATRYPSTTQRRGLANDEPGSSGASVLQAVSRALVQELQVRNGGRPHQ